MPDLYINPITGRRWKLTATERDFIINDRVTSPALLALQFGVHCRSISFIQHPDRYHANNEYTKAYRKKRRAETPPRPKKTKRPKRVPLDPYWCKIHAAVTGGAGVWDVENKLNENLSQLIRNRLALDEQIEETRKLQNALYRYVDITPVTLDPDFELRKNEAVVHMTAQEMKFYIVECGLTSKKLADEMKNKYSVRAIQSYRDGQSPVPRDVAELLRGYPRKTHLEEK